MAREQPIVARDFLGLGKMGDSTERDDLEGKHHAFHDADPSALLSLKKGGMLSNLHESNVCGMMGPAAAPFKGCALLNSMTFPGMKHPIWSKAATMQSLLPLRSLHEERFVEQSAENLLERSVQHFVHPSEMPDLVNKNQRNALCTQAWWQGDFPMNISTQAREECGPSAHFSGGFGGPEPKSMLSLSMSDVNVLGGVPAATEIRMASSGLTEMQGNAPLTIFYAGNVNVFNDVSAEKAQAIMFLAGGGNVQCSPVELLTAAVASESMPGMAAPKPHDKSHINLQSGQTVPSRKATANQVSHSTANMQLNFALPNIPAPSSPLPTGQHVVPRALPQARKASLARFLEKRRERVQLKSPYSLKQEDSSLPEERLSSSNDPASYIPCGDKKRVPMCSWIDRMSEDSTCDMIVKEEPNLTAA